jgi:L-rhamnose isomerase/sugar isomerase
MSPKTLARVRAALTHFRIELPSWGFADTGTRFGKFYQDAAAIDLNDKLADAGEVHRLTGCCPRVALHVLWDFAPGVEARAVTRLARRHGVKVGSINPNLFQDQEYKWGSLTHRDPAIRRRALAHMRASIQLGQEVGSDSVSLWLADGLSYPGQANLRERKHALTASLQACHRGLARGQTLLLEYKPFEPAFYATDLADWGMAYVLARKAGARAKVLVDTGHHYPGQNVEQIVAFLLDEGMLGGFHFNDRRYADDDLTFGSLDPYQAFRIFQEIHCFGAERGRLPAVAYMIDQSHNEKPKVEATIQTVVMAQELFAKAALVDQAALKRHQARDDVIGAEMILKEAFFTDLRPTLAAWRRARGLPPDPLGAYRRSGYAAQAAADRRRRRRELGLTRGGSYA